MVTATQLPNGEMLVTFMTDDPRPVSVVGNFNDWDPTRHPLSREIGVRRYTTVSVPPASRLVFRYLADGGEFYDDPDADRFEDNGYGQTHSVLDESLQPREQLREPDPSNEGRRAQAVPDRSSRRSRATPAAV